jgi:hypothetical protein
MNFRRFEFIWINSNKSLEKDERLLYLWAIRPICFVLAQPTGRLLPGWGAIYEEKQGRRHMAMAATPVKFPMARRR